jgi:hypothetical protein
MLTRTPCPARARGARARAALGVSRVSMLRRFVFAVIDRGERHARSASVGAACLGPGMATPWAPCPRPTPYESINPTQKYIRPEIPRAGGHGWAIYECTP